MWIAYVLGIPAAGMVLCLLCAMLTCPPPADPGSGWVSKKG
jgi:hypothetical protein